MVAVAPCLTACLSLPGRRRWCRESTRRFYPSSIGQLGKFLFCADAIDQDVFMFARNGVEGLVCGALPFTIKYVIRARIAYGKICTSGAGVVCRGDRQRLV